MRPIGSHAAMLFVEGFKTMFTLHRDGMGPFGLNAAVAVEAMP